LFEASSYAARDEDQEGRHGALDHARHNLATQIEFLATTGKNELWLSDFLNFEFNSLCLGPRFTDQLRRGGLTP